MSAEAGNAPGAGQRPDEATGDSPFPAQDAAPAAPAPEPPERRVYVGLGGNQGDMRANIKAAIDAIASIECTRVAAVSPLYRSAPVDAEGGDFINAVAALQTRLDPYALLLHLADLEMRLGRKRRAGDAPHSAPRSIDLDLLLMGSLILRSTPLVLPHPRMNQRAFVLRPLADLDPDLHVPGHGPVQRLLAAVSGQEVELLPE